MTADVRSLRVAGVVVDDPLTVLRKYAARYPGTLTRYDGGGAGDPGSLSRDEVLRTKVINSRISFEEANWFVARAGDAPWSNVPADAMLADADPSATGELYDAMEHLYRHFAGRPQVNAAKISKVLHLKRPALYPILDSRLMRSYGPAARRAAARYPDRGFRRMYWAAVRDDVLDETNVACLTALRTELRAASSPMAGLSDVRLLDIAAWSPG